jgi:hypothetical protein
MDDLAVPQHHRSGAHRARRHPLVAALVTIGAVGLASAVLFWALLTFDVLGVGDDLREEAENLDPVPSASVEPSAPAVEPSAPASSAPAAPSAEPSPEPEPEPEPAVDRTVTVDVLNSTSTPGLAAGAAEVLQGQGWTIGEVTNFAGGEIATTVLYPEESLRPTAEAVAAELGTGTTTLSADVTVLTVVLGPDYPGA